MTKQGQSRNARRMGTKSTIRIKCQRATRGLKRKARREIGMKS